MVPIGQFIGSSFPKLRLGSIITGPFEQISNFFPESAPVLFGALLKYGSSKKNYETFTGSDTAADFAGIAVNEIAASSNTYPGVKTQYEIAEPGNVLVVGSIAIKFSVTPAADAANAVEGSKVYVDAATGDVTDVATANILIPNLVFTGDSETVNEVLIVGVRKLY